MTVFGTTIAKEVESLPEYKVFGKVTDVVGMLIEVGGVQSSLSVGDHCEVVARNQRRVRCQVVGFSNNRALLMPFGAIEGVGMGCQVELTSAEPVIYPSEGWLGRVVNGFGEPVDGLCKLLAYFAVCTDKLIKFLLCQLRKNNCETGTHKPCLRFTSDQGTVSPRLICSSASKISRPSR